MAGERGLAEQIRTGLDGAPELKVVRSEKEPLQDPLDQRMFRKSLRQHVKEFGCVFGTIGLLVALYWLQTGGPLIEVAYITSASLVFAGLGYKAPHLLLPLWKGWMAVGHKMGLVVTFLILAAAWTLMVIPISLLLKVCSIRVMDLSFDRSVKSYWEERDQKLHDFMLLERQF